jgi:uncharacterized protein
MASQSFFESKEVSWEVDGIPVFGTLTIPAVNEKRSAVILVAGSGPTDRDWCSPLLPGTNGSGKLIAEALSQIGFVTLRYDKRASGPHVRENIPKMLGKISMQSHETELSGAMKTLLSSEIVNFDSVFALTNSEGTIHALNYQLHQNAGKFKGLIFTGAPGQSIGQIARNQIQNQVKNLLNSEDLMKKYDEAITAFLSGKIATPDPSLPEGIKLLLLGLNNPMNLPFSRELWNYNVSDFIANIPEPMLVIIGKKDIQVDWQIDGKALETATINKKNVIFVYPPNANHILKHEDKLRESLSAVEVGNSYNAEDRVLDKDVLTAILNWLNMQLRT